MQIFIKLPGGKMITVDVNPDMKIVDIKKHIESKQSFDVSTQELIFNGSKLKNAATVSEVNIRAESNLYLVINKSATSTIVGSGEAGSPEAMEITIMVSEKDRILLNVKNSDKISQLKQSISAKVGSSPKSINLFHRGQKLDDNNTVEECSISPGDIIAAILLVPGGFN